MITFKLFKTKIELHFSFFLMLGLFVLNSSRHFFVLTLCVCLIHEFAHVLAMIVFNVQADCISLYSGGIQISSTQVEKAVLYQKLVIYSAGCLANMLLSLFFFSQGNVIMEMINLIICVFNLLPIGELDGAKLLEELLIKFCKPERVHKYQMKIQLVSAVFVIMAISIVDIRYIIVVAPFLAHLYLTGKSM